LFGVMFANNEPPLVYTSITLRTPPMIMSPEKMVTLIEASGPALPNVQWHVEATQLQNSSEAYFCPNARQLG